MLNTSFSNVVSERNRSVVSVVSVSTHTRAKSLRLSEHTHATYNRDTRSVRAPCTVHSRHRNRKPSVLQFRFRADFCAARREGVEKYKATCREWKERKRAASTRGRAEGSATVIWRLARQDLFNLPRDNLQPVDCHSYPIRCRYQKETPWRN